MINAEDFLAFHKLRFSDLNIQEIVDEFIGEMKLGLAGPESSLRMIPTYIEAENEFLTEVPVVAIDAGGTNFRVATIKFTVSGKLQINDIFNANMPGLEGEISENEFFQTISGYVRSYAEKSERIGFCFSYPTEIYPNKDGKLLQFCKEVQAPGVIGQFIGKKLLETLGMQNKHIVLLNDTVATLLAGKSSSFGKAYDSYIGYILGTGTNTCYIELNANILKKSGSDHLKSQIINIESGNFSKATRSDIDISFDNTTSNPGEYTFEKMFSGGYFGGLCLSALKAAAEEGVFSAIALSKILLLNELSTEDVNRFVSKPASGRGPLHNCFKENPDSEASSRIIEALIERAAMLVAANLAAVMLKTGKGKSPELPVLITIEGSTFYKLHKLRSRFEHHFQEYLSGERKRYYTFAKVPQSSLVGAALAALIN